MLSDGFLGEVGVTVFWCSIDSAIGESKLSALESKIGEYDKQFAMVVGFGLALVQLFAGVGVEVVVVDVVVVLEEFDVVVKVVELDNEDDDTDGGVAKLVFVFELLLNDEWRSRDSGVDSREDDKEEEDDEIDSKQLSRSEFVRFNAEEIKLSLCKPK